MCIYCGTNKYRKIYENHFGPIPIDSDGRSYDIHHIDGNRDNNHPDNLTAITIQEHYDIHYAQGDYGACFLIAGKMKIKPETIRETARRSALRRSAEGRHNLQGKNNPVHQRIKDGSFQLEKRQHCLVLIEQGRHNFQGESNPSRRKVKNGTHPWLGGQYQRDIAAKRIKEGRHPFIGDKNPNKIQTMCPYCQKIGGYSGMMRWHFDNCKSKI